MLRSPAGSKPSSVSSRRHGSPDREVAAATQSDRTRRRILAERAGRRGEWLAAVWLMLKGYRILARRLRTRAGEIDIIAVRGRRLAFVEVKWRRHSELLDAAVTARQARRLFAAAQYWLQYNPRYRNHIIGLDRCDVADRWRVSHHPDTLQPPG